LPAAEQTDAQQDGYSVVKGFCMIPRLLRGSSVTALLMHASNSHVEELFVGFQQASCGSCTPPTSIHMLTLEVLMQHTYIHTAPTSMASDHNHDH
jgi:hypothetical protein